MDRYVMRHPETNGVGLVPASAVTSHKGRGWLRVSDAISEHDMDHVDVDAYADAPDLDASIADLVVDAAHERLDINTAKEK